MILKIKALLLHYVDIFSRQDLELKQNKILKESDTSITSVWEKTCH